MNKATTAAAGPSPLGKAALKGKKRLSRIRNNWDADFGPSSSSESDSDHDDEGDEADADADASASSSSHTVSSGSSTSSNSSHSHSHSDGEGDEGVPLGTFDWDWYYKEAEEDVDRDADADAEGDDDDDDSIIDSISTNTDSNSQLTEDHSIHLNQNTVHSSILGTHRGRHSRLKQQQDVQQLQLQHQKSHWYSKGGRGGIASQDDLEDFLAMTVCGGAANCAGEVAGDFKYAAKDLEHSVALPRAISPQFTPRYQCCEPLKLQQEAEEEVGDEDDLNVQVESEHDDDELDQVLAKSMEMEAKRQQRAAAAQEQRRKQPHAFNHHHHQQQSARQVVEVDFNGIQDKIMVLTHAPSGGDDTDHVTVGTTKATAASPTRRFIAPEMASFGELLDIDNTSLVSYPSDAYDSDTLNGSSRGGGWRRPFRLFASKSSIGLDTNANLCTSNAANYGVATSLDKGRQGRRRRHRSISISAYRRRRSQSRIRSRSIERGNTVEFSQLPLEWEDADGAFEIIGPIENRTRSRGRWPSDAELAFPEWNPNDPTVVEQKDTLIAESTPMSLTSFTPAARDECATPNEGNGIRETMETEVGQQEDNLVLKQQDEKDLHQQLLETVQSLLAMPMPAAKTTMAPSMTIEPAPQSPPTTTPPSSPPISKRMVSPRHSARPHRTPRIPPVAPVIHPEEFRPTPPSSPSPPSRSSLALRKLKIKRKKNKSKDKKKSIVLVEGGRGGSNSSINSDLDDNFKSNGGYRGRRVKLLTACFVGRQPYDEHNSNNSNDDRSPFVPSIQGGGRGNGLTSKSTATTVATETTSSVHNSKSNRQQKQHQQPHQQGSMNGINKRWPAFGGGRNIRSNIRSNVHSDSEQVVDNSQEQSEEVLEEEDWLNAESQFHKKKEEVLVTEQDATTHTIRVSRIPTEEFQERLARRASLRY